MASPVVVCRHRNAQAPQGCKGPEHGRPGRHGRRSLWGGLGQPNGETNRNFCQIYDTAGMS
ncbi:hypothetical protein CBM2634_A100195 [Cupriavidus taiwanensis]|uniref:Uncharacterized protein n=1 Tax=Cupriavidus taiwanensis TaxID=164546 RepID=A0A375IUI6_9BURK|nr:hypothetical protein CBM2634_A100195 [Cupriavidus taiwanensis]